MPREPPIVLPVSLPLLGHANPWALLLGAPLVLGGGGAGVQLTHAQLAVEGVAARQGVIAPGTPYALATGDKDAMLAFLRSRRPRRPV